MRNSSAAADALTDPAIISALPMQISEDVHDLAVFTIVSSRSTDPSIAFARSFRARLLR
jgi:hypothetical protein